MINIKFSKVFKILLKSFFSILALVCVIVIGIFLYYLFDSKAHCLDIGKIYDPVQKICRDDCLTWNDEQGCVPITEKNIAKKEKGEL